MIPIANVGYVRQQITGAGLGIQNCGCKITLMSSFGKFVGADLKNLKGLKKLSEKTGGAGAPTAPTLRGHS